MRRPTTSITYKPTTVGAGTTTASAGDLLLDGGKLGIVDNGNGSVTYLPDLGYSGSDSFDYVVTDGNDGTVHYWKLDGNGLDAVGTANGAVTGATTVAGHYGGGLEFDEVDDFIVTPDFAYTSDFSISFRFKIDDNPGNRWQYFYNHGVTNTANSVAIFLGEASSADPGILLTNVQDGNDSGDPTLLNIDVNSIIGDGLWHTYTVTVQSGVGSSVYLDGILENSDSGGGTLNADSGGGVVVSGTGTAMLQLEGNLVDLNTFLDDASKVDFTGGQDVVGNNADSIAITLNDQGNSGSGGGGDVLVATVDVDIAPINDPPEVTVVSPVLSYQENSGPRQFVPAATVADPDNGSLTGASFQIAACFCCR